MQLQGRAEGQSVGCFRSPRRNTGWGIIFVTAAGSVGRNVDEVLRVLDALQSDELCACNWKKGEATLNVGELLKESL